MTEVSLIAAAPSTLAGSCHGLVPRMKWAVRQRIGVIWESRCNWAL
ncbi:hypothetical protein SAMN05892877_12073 [Rhizobium subbaraonis]|uniref:Uncharacterized protein n=1 Tax=Rhizobium subbaraonis TaxID=908946 RepID=A0A285UWA3_9HYPH|nr:hypothetical protein SAMN05892877_12073 [Rhizobium subbaraonis]